MTRSIENKTKMRAARELEDLRMEKESLQVMKQQLAAVHQLRIDLQRKDSVIQARGRRERERELFLLLMAVECLSALMW